MAKEKRYEERSTSNGTWAVYDKERKVTILKSVSPLAAYNKEVVKKVVELLNDKPI